MSGVSVDKRSLLYQNVEYFPEAWVRLHPLWLKKISDATEMMVSMKARYNVGIWLYTGAYRCDGFNERVSWPGLEVCGDKSRVGWMSVLQEAVIPYIPVPRPTRIQHQHHQMMAVAPNYTWSVDLNQHEHPLYGDRSGLVDDEGGGGNYTSVYYNVSILSVNTTTIATKDMTTGKLELSLQPYSMTHLLATAIALGLLILATIIGNVFVIAAIILEKNLQHVANYLIISLAVADLMVASLVMPLAAVNEVSRQWFLGPEICDMWISFDVLCCTSSILHLVAIALDRYWAVTQVDYIRNRSAKRILLMIALSWTVSVSISIPPLFGWKDQNNSPELTGQCLISQDWGYTVFSTVGAFYMPLLFMMIIYIKIYRAAKFRIRKKNFKTLGKAAPKPLLCPTSGPPPVEGHNTLTLSSMNQSPDLSSNGSAVPLNDANRNNKHQLSPPASPLLKEPNKKSSYLDITKIYLDIRKGSGNNSPKKKEKQRERLEQKRERKAARTLAIITGSFVCSWLPFFIIAVVRPFCGESCHYPILLMSVIGWLGYFNSLLNPVIYTIFNPDFRKAFKKILFGKYRKQRRHRWPDEERTHVWTAVNTGVRTKGQGRAHAQCPIANALRTLRPTARWHLAKMYQWEVIFYL